MLHNLGSEHLNSILTEKLPAILVEPIKSEYVTKSKFKSEIEFEITQINNYIIEIYKDLNKKINDQDKEIKDLKETVRNLEIKNKPKPTPNQERAEILYNKVMNATSLNSKEVMKELGVKQHVQAIRAMETTARIYSNDIELFKYDTGKKSYSLRRRIDSSINPYIVRV